MLSYPNGRGIRLKPDSVIVRVDQGAPNKEGPKGVVSCLENSEVSQGMWGFESVSFRQISTVGRVVMRGPAKAS